MVTGFATRVVVALKIRLRLPEGTEALITLQWKVCNSVACRNQCSTGRYPETLILRFVGIVCWILHRKSSPGLRNAGLNWYLDLHAYLHVQWLRFQHVSA